MIYTEFLVRSGCHETGGVFSCGAMRGDRTKCQTAWVCRELECVSQNTASGKVQIKPKRKASFPRLTLDSGFTCEIQAPLQIGWISSTMSTFYNSYIHLCLTTAAVDWRSRRLVSTASSLLVCEIPGPQIPLRTGWFIYASPLPFLSAQHTFLISE